MTQTRESAMSRKKHLLSLGFVLLLLGLTAYFLLRGNKLPELLAAVQSADVRWLLAGVGIIAVFFLMEALSARTLLRSFGYKMSLSRCGGYSLVDFYFSSITPACCAGQPAQICYMARDGVALGSSSLALLLFNLCYHVGVLLIAGTVLLCGGMATVAQTGVLRWFLLYGAVAQLFLALMFVVAVFSKRLMPALVRVASKLLVKVHLVKDGAAFAAKAEAQVAEYRQGAEHIRRHPFVLLRVLLYTVAHLLCLYLVPYFVYRAFGLTDYSLLGLIAIQSSLVLALESVPIPGGIGLTEGSFLAVYAPIFGGPVLAALLLVRGLTYYVPLAVSGVCAAVMQKKKAPRSAFPVAHSRSAFSSYGQPDA